MTPPRAQAISLGRSPAKLSSALNKALLSYVAAAGAASLTLPLHAEAEVVYTPANIPLNRNTPVPLDLNHDGIVDFELNNHYSVRTSSSCFGGCVMVADLNVSPVQPGNAEWAFTSSVISTQHRPPSVPIRKPATRKMEVALPAPWGILVAEQRKFQAIDVPLDYFRQSATISGHSMRSVGAWGKGKQFAGPYIGFKFMINDEIHYGWARIEVNYDRTKITATLTGYAYETVPNRGIVTGLTYGPTDQCAQGSSTPSSDMKAGAGPTLGRLAHGADSVAHN